MIDLRKLNKKKSNSIWSEWFEYLICAKKSSSQLIKIANSGCESPDYFRSHPTINLLNLIDYPLIFPSLQDSFPSFSPYFFHSTGSPHPAHTFCQNCQFQMISTVHPSRSLRSSSGTSNTQPENSQKPKFQLKSSLNLSAENYQLDSPLPGSDITDQFPNSVLSPTYDESLATPDPSSEPTIYNPPSPELTSPLPRPPTPPLPVPIILEPSAPAISPTIIDLTADSDSDTETALPPELEVEELTEESYRIQIKCEKLVGCDKEIESSFVNEAKQVHNNGNIKLYEIQQRIIMESLLKKLTIIIGPPGTGKTVIIFSNFIFTYFV